MVSSSIHFWLRLIAPSVEALEELIMFKLDKLEALSVLFCPCLYLLRHVLEGHRDLEDLQAQQARLESPRVLARVPGGLGGSSSNTSCGPLH